MFKTNWKKKHNYKESFVQEQLWIVGIENVVDIDRKCNIRIEKNRIRPNFMIWFFIAIKMINGFVQDKIGNLDYI